MFEAKLPNLNKIMEDFKNNEEIKLKTKNVQFPDFRLTTFIQLWGSTATGWDGWGGSAMTFEYTSVVFEVNSCSYGIYFGDKLAYLVFTPNEIFFKDLKEQNMASVFESKKYF